MSLLLASIIFKKTNAALVNNLVSLAVGTLLAASFLEIIPHAMEASNNNFHDISFTVLIGILILFILEKLMIWRHCHGSHCHKHTECDTQSKQSKLSGNSGIIVIGDLFHNFVDGILIAAAFLANPAVGLLTAAAIIAHEIPQEIGNFMVMLNAGFSRARALIYNLICGLLSVIGGVIGYFFLEQTMTIIPYLLVFASSSFIYIAVSDLMPQMHRRFQLRESIRQISTILLGVLVVIGLSLLEH